MRNLIFASILVVLSSCATPPSWDERLSKNELQELQESRQKFTGIANCAADCSTRLNADHLKIKVNRVFVHGYKYAIVGNIAENVSITCELTPDKKTSEVDLKKVQVGQMLSVTGPLLDYLKTSTGESVKISPCTILSDL